ncbi:MAG: hypothetical protein K9N09_09125 [Candidatus Cloacimonetes bacterium]|nr:hypothetical protein [Candidatus Cloacimonadota bacterium]MCF7814202.1 hypothetical protein [Candidatus Cloacimonadota bacterium]MCF7868849.1 hypothetical protein [Candidatus Cloacimonadota bacterium]MCF7884258.1 hypothetical protein [Candidatus Cloacimonadota bacterium]
MKRGFFFISLLILICFFCNSCSEQKTTEVTVQDNNQDEVYSIGPQSGLLGNVDLLLIPETLQGSAIVIINGPGSAIGYDFRNLDNSSIIYFGDSYIAAGGNSLQSGTLIPLNEWVKIRLVIYESGLAGWVVTFLQYLGLDFFDSVEDYMIDEVFEIEVILESGPDKINVIWSDWKRKLKEIK